MVDAETVRTIIKGPSGLERNMPAIRCVVRLTHPAARHVYARTYEIGNRALYQLETMSRPPKAAVPAARLERDIDERLAGLGRDLEEAIQGARRRLAENGIAWNDKPLGDVAIEALMSARRSAVTLGLFERFDTLVGVLEMAQHVRAMSQKDGRAEMYRWQRRLIRTVLVMAGTIHKEADVLLKREKAGARPRRTPRSRKQPRLSGAIRPRQGRRARYSKGRLSCHSRSI